MYTWSWWLVKMSFVHGSLDNRSGGMWSCRRWRRVVASRAFQRDFPIWTGARRRDRTPSSIVWLDTQKKNKCYDSKNNVEKPHDSLSGEANRLGDEIQINWICGCYAYEEEIVLIVIYMHAYPMVSLGFFIVWFVWRVWILDY